MVEGLHTPKGDFIMKKAINRIIVLLVFGIFTMSFGTIAFASNTTESLSPDSKAFVLNDTSNRVVGDLLYSSGQYFTNSCTITIITTSANWDADFYLTVSENSSATYNVVMTAANGSVYSQLVGGGGGSAHFNMSYAKAGTYTFQFYLNNGSSNTAFASVQIFD